MPAPLACDHASRRARAQGGTARARGRGHLAPAARDIDVALYIIYCGAAQLLSSARKNYPSIENIVVYTESELNNLIVGYHHRGRFRSPGPKIDP